MKPHAESRVGATLAVIALVAMSTVFPNRYMLGPRWVSITVGIALILAMIVPVRDYQNAPRVRMVLSGAVVALASLLNFYFLVLLVLKFAEGGAEVKGILLMRSAGVVWVGNIVIFALWYWHVDRGGPEGRALSPQPAADFIWPQGPDSEWKPTFPDYLFLAFTTATAFSPTDTLPLTHRVKLLVAIEALTSLITIAIVAARAVNIM